MKMHSNEKENLWRSKVNNFLGKFYMLLHCEPLNRAQSVLK